jgi:soluble cytochrome b562
MPDLIGQLEEIEARAKAILEHGNTKEVQKSIKTLIEITGELDTCHSGGVAVFCEA